MNQFFMDIVTHPLFGFFCGLVGFAIGHRFAIDRDKRKEWNDLVAPIHRQLESRLLVKTVPIDIKFNEWFLMEPHIHFWQRKALNRAIQKQKKTSDKSLIREDHVLGEVEYDPDIVKENHRHTIEVLKVLKLK